MIFDTIIVTTDLSENSYAAFDIALYQAKISDARIVLVSVFEEFTIPPVLRKQISNPDTVEKLKKEYEQEQLDEIAKLQKERFHGHEVTTRVIFSDKRPSAEISAVANEEGAGMIVISSQGRGALGSFVLGSTVQALVREAVCPLLVIPKITN